MTQGICRSGFDLDLKQFAVKEGELASLLVGGTSNGQIEVKSDQRCCGRDSRYTATGNLFVEYRQKGRKSGISITTAAHWAFEYYDGCWLLVATSVLRAAARKAYRDKSRRRVGGDNNEYEGVLVPIAWLVRPDLSLSGEFVMEAARPVTAT